jgi:hypothetical protein
VRSSQRIFQLLHDITHTEMPQDTLENHYKQEDFSQYDWEFLQEMLDDIVPYVQYGMIPSWFHCLALRFKRQPFVPFWHGGKFLESDE